MQERYYKPDEVEKKWQDIWDEKKAFVAEDVSDKPKFYGLIEFPYPSGDGLHVGHPKSNTAIDILCRKRRMEGYNVLYPIGWDAFGLPTENYAIKKKIHPRIVTQANIQRFKSQLKTMGFSFDWSREIDTTDPSYYKWTQWIFLKFFEKGLAYKAEIPINWCMDCKIGLANEEVVDGVCERCGGPVEKRVKNQWMLKITDYAEKLVSGLDNIDFIEKVKTQQRNWIGKSLGAEVNFAFVEDNTDIKITDIRVFTTRPDTLFGATYMVISPEHPVITANKEKIKNLEKVNEYIQASSRKSDFERSELAKEKTGIELEGIKAINPVTGKKIPVWVSDYVLMSYGTGAIMAVPGHDTRDYEFAKKFGLPVVEVVKGGDIIKEAYTDIEDGVMVNSGFLDGMNVKRAKEEITKWLEDKKLGSSKVNYKLRDWVFSRQRYWGEPIPIIHCEKCSYVPVPESDLPVVLPDVGSYQPTGDGQSPLAAIKDWVNVKCPVCGGNAERETDTMPNWAGSSWYFLRYIDPHNDKEFASMEKLKYWLPIDWYNGGMEHTTLHLLYSRFWHQFLYDIGKVPTPEPYMKRTSHGMILGANNEKMSKSRGNVINPDDVIKTYGADSFRLYEMFMGAFDQPTPWSEEGLKGCRRFLDRVWKLQYMVQGNHGYTEGMEGAFHKTIKKVGEDYEKMKFNTAIAALMALVNDIYKVDRLTKNELGIFMKLLNPAVPHMTEELWEIMGFKGYIYNSDWPAWDEEKIKDDAVEIAVQVNGKLRGLVKVDAGSEKEAVKSAAMCLDDVIKHVEGKNIVKEIFVKDKILNFVVKD